MKNITLSNRVLPLEIRVNPQAKRLILRLDRSGKSLRVTVPKGTREQQITDFLAKCQGWIENRLEKIPVSACGEPMLRDGVKIPYLGVPHLIVHQAGRGLTRLSKTPQEQFPKSVTRFSDKNCGKNKDLEQFAELSEAKTALAERQIIVTGEAAHLPRRLADFLKNQARATLVPLAHQYAKQVERQPKSIQFKDTTSRWGSCSSSGTLSFSWRIMMAPLSVVQYLVAHEVAHLVEMNHGEHFWQICTELCPRTPQCRAWLKRNGQALQAIDFT